MLECVICDDESVTRERLGQYLARFENETGERLNVTEFVSGDELLRGYPRSTDLILLDIQMKGTDGMEVARAIRGFDRDVCIIFITSMYQMALEGFKVRAFGFLRKPVTYAELRHELQEAIARIRSGEKHAILLKSGTELHKLTTSDILYVEVRNHNVEVHTTAGPREFYTQLKEVEAQLAGQGFFCPHASFLVNQRYIARVGKESLTLTDGTVVPISKHRKKGFLVELTKYVGDQI